VSTETCSDSSISWSTSTGNTSSCERGSGCTKVN
jgi:hypothetical protein